MTDKYKLFRNYMANELSITRDDIKEWAQDAVQEQTRKSLGQIDVRRLVERAVYEHSVIVRQDLVRELTIKLSNRIKIIDIPEDKQ